MLKLIKNKFFTGLLLLLSQFLLGFGIIEHVLPLVILGVLLWYTALSQIMTWATKQIILLGTLANIIFLFVCTQWFNDITLFGWSTVAGINIKIWLMTILLFIHFISSIIFAFSLLLAKKVWHHLNLQTFSISSLIFSAYIFVVAEILRSFLFAVFTYGNNNTIGPVWGIFSIATLSQGTFLHNIPASFGYWGTSFILYCLALLPFLFFAKYKTARALPFIIVVLIFFATKYGPSIIKNITNKQQAQVIVLSKKSQNDYLGALSHLTISEKKMSVLVLPEYDNLLNPGFGLPAVALDGTRKQTVLNKLTTISYIAGTQDAYSDDKRYAQNYLANKQGKFIKVRSKQFLIPGGEYIIGWVAHLFSAIDPTVVQTFNKNRGRYVISDNRLKEPVVFDENSQLISTGSCSDVLSPYYFRNDVKQGAQLITLNISFAQFTNTSVYERFTKNYMTFIANAYQRPVAAGVQDGQALFISPYNNEGLKQEDIIAADIPYNTHMTLYTKLGDLNILLLLTGLTATTLLYPTIKRRVKDKISQNRR